MQRESPANDRDCLRGMPAAPPLAYGIVIMLAMLCAACSSSGRPRSADAVRNEIVAAEMRGYETAPAIASADAQDARGTTPAGAQAAALGTAASMHTTSRIEGDTGIIDIFAPSPVGGLALAAPPGGWPGSLSLRFHRMNAMQGFTARSRFAHLACEAPASDGKDAPHLCTLDGGPVDAVTRTLDGYDVRLPPALLSAQDRTLEVRWVEHYR